MTPFGHATVTAVVVALATVGVLAVAFEAGQDAGASWPVAGAADSAIPGAARTYSVGRSDLVATSRIAVTANSGLELTNLGAPGFLLLESGVLVLVDAEGVIDVRRADTGAATLLPPVGIGSRLGRGDRIAFRSATTIALHNPGSETPASILMITEMPAMPHKGAWQ